MVSTRLSIKRGFGGCGHGFGGFSGFDGFSGFGRFDDFLMSSKNFECKPILIKNTYNL